MKGRFGKNSPTLVRTGVHKCSSIFRSSVARLGCAKIEERSAESTDQTEQATHSLVTSEHVHTNAQNTQSFFLPACTDIHKCQLRRINYADDTITQHPLRNVQTLGSKQSPCTRWTSSSAAACMHSLKPSPCIWEAAWGGLWVCESARESERRQGQSVRSSGGNGESVFWMHRWRQCGGSDVAGIITGWQSIWNIWDRESAPSVSLNTGHLLDVAVTPLSIGAHVPSIGGSLRSTPGPWRGRPAWGFGPVAAEEERKEILNVDQLHITMCGFIKNLIA